MKIAFIYGGQGSQVEGMGQDLYETYPFIQAFYDSVQLSFPLKDLSFKGDLMTISKTEYTQAILLAFQIAATKVLAFHGITATIAMGLSLGEYAALYAAGVLDEKTLLETIEYRSQAMAKAAEALDSKMLAVFSDDLKRLEELCQTYSVDDARVEVSNINTKGQIVLSGDAKVIQAIGDKLKTEGYKFKELNTSGPFHTSYMDSVAKSLADRFEGMDFKEPRIPIIHNLDGKLHENLSDQNPDIEDLDMEAPDIEGSDREGRNSKDQALEYGDGENHGTQDRMNQDKNNQDENNQDENNQDENNQDKNNQDKNNQFIQDNFTCLDIKETMAKQVNHPVLFKASLEELLKQKPDLILEIGYGNVIKGLMKRIDKSVPVVSINSVESIGELINLVGLEGTLSVEKSL